MVREFFAAAGNLHPTAIAPTHVCSWRDALLRRKQKAATVSFKLSLVRAFFGYLKDLGLVERNKLDAQRRQHLHSGGTDAYLFQPLVNYRLLEFAKPLSPRMVWNIMARWGNWGGVE